MTKNELLQLRRVEVPKTVRLLEMYGETKHDLTPSDKSRSAIQLATTFLNEERLNRMFVERTAFDPATLAKMQVPKSVPAIAAELGKTAEALNRSLESMSDDEFYEEVEFFGRCLPLADALLGMLLDHIH